jgi:hypothetical protein
MLKFLPMGWIGLMVAGLIAANSSTILTHLNWGASYLVHDFYRRFVRTDASERHYVSVGRLATVVLYVSAAALTFVLESAKDHFDIILQIGAGTGLLYLLRWFWWRINAWCEVAAMVSSFGVSVAWLVLKKCELLVVVDPCAPLSPEKAELLKHAWKMTTHEQLLLTIAVTTVCWVLTAFVTGLQTDRRTLVAFYKKVRPIGPGWGPIRAEIGPSDDAGADRENIPLALLGWVAGCTVIWSALFTVGNYLYGRMLYGHVLLGVFVVSGAVLIRLVNRLWTAPDPPPSASR